MNRPASLCVSEESNVSVYHDVAPPESRVLSDEHRTILEGESGIAPDVVEARGYYSLSRAQVIDLVEQEIYTPAVLKGDGWLAIPILRPDGQIHGEVLRVDNSPLKQKYAWPVGERNAVAIHPFSGDYLDDRTVSLLIAEGLKKADALLSAARREGIPVCVLAINGNYGWRATVDGNKIACPDFGDIPLNDRKVYIIPDSDYRSNDMVARGWDELGLYLASKSGDNRTQMVVVPPDGTKKQGADDYLAAGHSLDSLLGLAQSLTRAKSDKSDEPTPLLVKTGARLIAESGEHIPYIIQPLLPEASIILIAGHSGTLKTWHTLAMGVDLAMGYNWLNHPGLTARSTPMNVLFVNKEMSGIILGQRLRLLVRNNRYSEPTEDIQYALDNRIFTTDEAILDLTKADQRDRLEEAIVINNIGFVVLDSLSMCWTGDENSNSEVGGLYMFLRGITERTHVAWGPVHHLDKPQGNAKYKHNILFTIRGAGQLGQQADAAIILNKFEVAGNNNPDIKHVSIIHAKARTAQEIPAFITEFNSGDGQSVSLKYYSDLSGAQEKEYTASGRDPAKLDEWILTTIRESSSMAVGAPGIRANQFAATAMTSWTGEEKDRPRQMEIVKRLDALHRKGALVVLDSSTKGGKLYGLADMDGPKDESSDTKL